MMKLSILEFQMELEMLKVNLSNVERSVDLFSMHQMDKLQGLEECEVALNL